MADDSNTQGSAGWIGSTDSSHPFNAHHFQTRQHQATVRTNMPVKVMAVHQDSSGNYTLDVQPLVNQVDGAGNSQPHGIIYGIPVHATAGANGSALVVPAQNDMGWMSIGDRDHSSALASGGQANPGSRRMHDLADGYYMGGMAGLNKPAHSIVMSADGIQMTTSKTVSINAANGLNVTGNIAVTGNVTATQNISATGTVTGSNIP